MNTLTKKREVGAPGKERGFLESEGGRQERKGHERKERKRGGKRDRESERRLDKGKIEEEE